MNLKTKFGIFSLFAVIGYVGEKVFRGSLTFGMIDAIVIISFTILGLILLVNKK